MTIDASETGYRELNSRIRANDGECLIENCLGQRFIGSGMSGKNITIKGTPGNALGAYLGDSRITVRGNAQDAVGDTMNGGEIVVEGNIGDAAGYAMRGGEIYIKGNAGYRVGIHMKEYMEKKPVIVIGGRVGSFLGEYQAGGIIIVLGLNEDGKPIVGDFPCTGMHGGRLYIRGELDGDMFPGQVSLSYTSGAEIKPYIEKFCRRFGYDAGGLSGCSYTVITPDSKNPYKQMYVQN